MLTETEFVQCKIFVEGSLVPRW